ncbi:transketolase-like TK C-terminal-containing protein [Holospora curviuscula]|uniref:transketolase n=1 Tax=Holospora curviuscula TaxID=1082868 RepID=A0A2S5RDL8_9PROT|nr:transketolase [Holospora curviuscula]PPE05302.1 Transketolase [Holospora curviuscula]
MSLAGHWRLHQLIVFWDDNGVTIDGPVSLSQSDDIIQRFKASGWNTLSIDGHDFSAIHRAIECAHKACQPTLIGCRTRIGYGSPNKMGSCHVHGSPLGAQETQAVRKALSWPWEEPFFVPESLLIDWKYFTHRSFTLRNAWRARLSQQSPQIQARFYDALNSSLLNQETIEQLKLQRSEYEKTRPWISTRSASGAVLAGIFPHTRLLTGSADLKDSTCTAPEHWNPYRPFLHYGIREHAMAAVMNGIAAHGGFIPCGGTFLVFSDYLRPALRLSALMGVKVIYIMTHDSIGLGEDGPTHQPIEHLVSLRAIPNLTVLRPGDSIEVVECWEIALKVNGPVVLCLSRQPLPYFRNEGGKGNQCEEGAYPLVSVQVPKVNIWASGSEVSLALAVAENLREGYDISSQVYSVPWLMYWLKRYPEPWSVFPAQLQVSIEAASPLGWYQVTGPGGLNIGMERFGASGSCSALFETFGFSVSTITSTIVKKIQENTRGNPPIPPSGLER